LALAVGAVVAGVLYLNAKSDYDEHNNPETDDATKSELHSKAKTIGWVCNGLAAGAVVSGGISTYLFLAPDSGGESDARAAIRSPGIAGAQFGIVGRF